MLLIFTLKKDRDRRNQMWIFVWLDLISMELEFKKETKIDTHSLCCQIEALLMMWMLLLSRR